MKPRALVAWAGGVGLAFTVVVVVVPTVRFAYEAPRLHVALETAAILIGGLAGLLVFGRFRQTGSSQDLALVYVLGVLAMTNLFLATVPAVLDMPRNEEFLAWAQTTARFVAAIILAVAAFARGARVRNPGLAGKSVVAASLATLTLVAIATLVATPLLPAPLGRVVLSEEAFRPRVDGHPVFLMLQLGQMAAFGIAAIGFLRTAERDDSAITPWVAAGCVLAAFSRFSYFLFPSRYTDFVYIGDILRLGFYLCLLVGGIREITSYWRTLADARVGEARRRLARDLHDGLAQELVFITAQTRRLVDRAPEPHELQRLSGAADRAVAESRRAIDLLASEREQTLRDALIQLGEEMERRVRTSVVIDADEVEVHPAIREGALRIVREAVMNAIRHSGADTVSVSLRDGEPFSLTVRDAGAGFDPGDQGIERKGFGLITMRERARALDGDIRISSRDGTGTQVSILLPKQPSDEG